MNKVMADLFELTGINGVDIAKYVKQKWFSNDYKTFIAGIKKIVKVACNEYRKYCTDSPEKLQYDFLDNECENEICYKIQQNLDDGQPFTIDGIFSERHDLSDYERNLLFIFLSRTLNKSLEFCLRDYMGWIHQTEADLSKEVSDIKNVIRQLEISTIDMNNSIEKLPVFWQVKHISYEWIQKCKRDAMKKYENIKYAYYKVTDKEYIISSAVCADLDCPNSEAIGAVNETLEKSSRHLFIGGNTGEGKTSLLFRVAVEYTKRGQLCFWLRLYKSGMSPTDSYNAKLLLDSINKQAMVSGTTAFLFIDNLYQGVNMLNALNDAWTDNYNIRLIASEHTSYMKELCSRNCNIMSSWFNQSEFLCFHSPSEIDALRWMPIYKLLPISLDWKQNVVKNMISTEQASDQAMLNNAKDVVFYITKGKTIPLVQLMFMVIIQYNKNINENVLSISKNILLDWDVWDMQIREEFNSIIRESFCCIAALFRIGMPVSTVDFTTYYDLNERLFKDFIERKYNNSINSPIQIINEGNKIFIAPKNDLIPDIYFEFKSDSAKSDMFDKYMSSWLEFMTDGIHKIDTMNYLASWYEKNNNFEKAFEFYNKAIVICEKILGKDHLTTAKTYHNIAGICHNQGMYNEALEFYDLALEIRERVLGKNDPTTAITYNDKAVVYNKQGEYGEAIKYYSKVLDLGESYFSLLIVTAYNNIAGVYIDLCKYEEALMFYDNALSIYKRYFGEEHPTTATVYNNIAAVYHNQGKYLESIQLYNKSIKISEKVYGAEHPSISLTYNNIAEVYVDQDDFQTAKEFYNKALTIYEKRLGEEHPYTAETYHGMARLYHTQGEYGVAIELYKKALRIREEKLGTMHPYTAVTYNDMAVLYEDQSEYEIALNFYNKALVIRESKFGENHLHTALIYNNIAGIYKVQGKCEEALKLYGKALFIREKFYGGVHPDIAITYTGMAGVYKNQRDYNKAIELYKKALEINKKFFNSNHHSFAQIYNNMARVYAEQREHETALRFYNEALAIYKNIYGTEHPYIATVYDNIAGVYHDLRDYETARRFYNMALVIRENKLGKNDPATVITYNNLAVLYHDEYKRN